MFFTESIYLVLLQLCECHWRNSLNCNEKISSTLILGLNSQNTCHCYASHQSSSSRMYIHLNVSTSIHKNPTTVTNMLRQFTWRCSISRSMNIRDKFFFHNNKHVSICWVCGTVWLFMGHWELSLLKLTMFILLLIYGAFLYWTLIPCIYTGEYIYTP